MPKYTVRLTMRETSYSTGLVEVEANDAYEAEAKAEALALNFRVQWRRNYSDGIEILPEFTEFTSPLLMAYEANDNPEVTDAE